MTTRPSYLPGWVASGNGRSGDFALAMKLAGWAPGEKPAAEEVNEFWANVSDWLAYLDTVDTAYDTLEALIAGLGVGQTGILDEEDGDDQPGTIKATTGALFGTVSISSDGTRVWHAGLIVCIGVPRALSGAGLTLTKTSAGNTVRVVSDGAHVAWAYGNHVELFNAITGASVWDYDQTAAVTDVCMDRDRVYLTGTADGAGHRVVAITRSTGVKAWGYDPGAIPAAVCTDGKRVYYGGVFAGSQIQALVAANGNDAVADPIQAWVINYAANSNVLQATLATDGRFLVVGWPAGAGDEFQVRSCADGSLIYSKAFASDIVSVSIDDDYVYATENAATNQVHAYDKRSGAKAWIYEQSVGAFNAIDADGAALYCMEGTFLKKVRRGNRPKNWRRVDPSSASYKFLPYRRPAIPHE